MSTDGKTALSTLLAEYVVSNDAAIKAKQVLDEANKKRNDIAKRIYEQLGRRPY